MIQNYFSIHTLKFLCRPLKLVNGRRDQNKVSTEKSGDVSYDYLVVAPGLVMAPELLPGLSEAMDKKVVCSNYTDPEHTWEVLKNFKGGNAVFTQPTTPIKCGGAPQKIMYLAEEFFRKAGVREKTNVIFATPGTVIFGVPDFAKTLNKHPGISPRVMDVFQRLSIMYYVYESCHLKAYVECRYLNVKRHFE